MKYESSGVVLNSKYCEETILPKSTELEVALEDQPHVQSKTYPNLSKLIQSKTKYTCVNTDWCLSGLFLKHPMIVYENISETVLKTLLKSRYMTSSLSEKTLILWYYKKKVDWSDCIYLWPPYWFWLVSLLFNNYIQKYFVLLFLWEFKFGSLDYNSSESFFLPSTF